MTKHLNNFDIFMNDLLLEPDKERENLFKQQAPETILKQAKAMFEHKNGYLDTETVSWISARKEAEEKLKKEGKQSYIDMIADDHWRKYD